MSDNKSTLTQAREALARAKNTVSSMREKGTEYTREGVGTLINGAVAFGAGYADQRYGEVDAETGIRLHRTNKAPTVLAVGCVAKVAAALGIAGDTSWAVYRAGDGGIGAGMTTFGRMAGERMRRKSEKSATETKTGKVAAKKAA